MRITNKFDFPQALVDAVRNDPYDNEGAWRSVTQLISPPRQVVLKKQHDDEIEEDVADRLWSLYGQIVHEILARANVKDLVEERLSTVHMSKLISGGFDILQLDKGNLIDWKFSSVYKASSTAAIDDWVAQVNLLALLFRRKKIEISSIEINLLMRDHKKSKARREPNYPQHGSQRIPLILWSREEQEDYLDRRVRLHLAAEEHLPDCTPAEQWMRPNFYAVMKKGKNGIGRAIKGGVVKERQLADALMKEDKERYLEVRHGEPVRCLDFCSVAPFCDQFKREAFHGPAGYTGEIHRREES